MTIALAFDCANGAVLCADTQMTSDGGFKFQDSKMVEVAESRGWTVLGVYAGNPQLAQSVQTHLYDDLFAFDGKKPPAREQFEKLLQKTLNRVCSKGQGHLQMIWAFSHKDRVDLYRTDRRTITIFGDFACLGIGDCSLVRFLAAHLSHIPVAEGVKAAYYIASQAMRYVDGVGGEIELIAIYRGGRTKSLNPGKNPGAPSWDRHDLSEKIVTPRITKKERAFLKTAEQFKKAHNKIME